MMKDELEKNVNGKNVVIDQKKTDDAVVNKIDVTKNDVLMNEEPKNDGLKREDVKSNKNKNGRLPSAITQAVADV
jgi:hypothetical protein